MVCVVQIHQGPWQGTLASNRSSCAHKIRAHDAREAFGKVCTRLFSPYTRAPRVVWLTRARLGDTNHDQQSTQDRQCSGKKQLADLPTMYSC